MNLLPISSITIPERRHRRYFDEARLEELAQSIEEHGLVHLPVCRPIENGKAWYEKSRHDEMLVAFEKAELVSGERRLRAILMLHMNERPVRYMGQLVPPGQLPFAWWSDLSSQAAREVELEENTRRADLTWHERVQAEAELAQLRREQGLPRAKILEELEADTTDLKETELLAANLHRPAVAKAPSRSEALKVLKREKQHEYEAELSKTIRAEDSRHVLKCVDAIEGCRSLPNEYFDCILTDPPYGVGADKFGMGTDSKYVNVQHEYQDSQDYMMQLVRRINPELFRVAAKQAHLYLFCDVRYFTWLEDQLKSEGWDVWPRPLIWHKDVGMRPRVEHGPRRVYECILYALKGDKPIREAYDDVLVYPAVKEKEHAAAKPVELYKFLLSRSVLPGSKVLDPFCGSGPIFPAANMLKCEATGFDIDPVSVGKASLRLKEGL